LLGFSRSFFRVCTLLIRRMNINVYITIASLFDRVFTSYSFMVDHAGDLSTDHVFLGPQYICCTILFACGSFKLGKLFAQTYLIGPDAFHMFDFTHIKLYPSFLFYLLGFNLCTVIRATFGPIGFVRYVKSMLISNYYVIYLLTSIHVE
jgi:hypothetical protein